LSNKLETTLQALIKEKDKWNKALDEVSKSWHGCNSQPFQDACWGIYNCELEMEKLKARMLKYKKYANINFPESTLLHVTDFPDDYPTS